MTVNSDRYQRALDCLASFTTPRSVVWDCLDQLTREDLQRFGLDFYFYKLNFFSLLGKVRTSQEIDQLASTALRWRLWEGWSAYSYAASVVEKEKQSNSLCGNSSLFDEKLHCQDPQRIHELLRHGKGLVLCAHHFGLYRYLPAWLGSKGFKVCSPLDRVSFEQTDSVLRRGRTTSGEQLSFADNITLLNVEQEVSLKPLLRSLRANQIVLIYVDGNTGADGPHGTSAKSTIEFGGLKAQVKNGPARLSVMAKAPLLEVIAPRSSPSQESSADVVFGATFFPPEQADWRRRDDFVEQCTQHLYTFLEQHFVAHPEQWESCRLFHRWRVPKESTSAVASDPATGEVSVRDALSRGKTLRLNQQLLLPLGAEGDTWIDVDTLRVYKQSPQFPTLFNVLSSEEGLRAGWLAQQAQNSAGEEALISTLTQLASQNLVVAA